MNLIFNKVLYFLQKEYSLYFDLMAIIFYKHIISDQIFKTLSIIMCIDISIILNFHIFQK